MCSYENLMLWLIPQETELRPTVMLACLRLTSCSATPFQQARDWCRSMAQGYGIPALGCSPFAPNQSLSFLFVFLPRPLLCSLWILNSNFGPFSLSFQIFDMKSFKILYLLISATSVPCPLFPLLKYFPCAFSLWSVLPEVCHFY